MISTQTFRGLPLGINQAMPVHEIPDGAARWVQDALLDKAGEVRQRGPVTQSVDATATPAGPPSGMFQLIADDGSLRMGVLIGTTTPKINMWSDPFSGVTHSENFSSQDWTTPPVWQARAGLSGGVLIGTAEAPGISTDAAALALWRGGTKGSYSTGTITVSRGSTAVTGSGTTWSTNVNSGMFLFTTSAGQKTIIGEVATVNSNTSITLKRPALAAAAAAAYTVSPLRGISARVGKGRITTVSGDTTVLGAGTKFNMMDILGETWDLYRASDLAWIGTVSSVTNDRALELSASAATVVANESYIAIRLAPTANFTVDQAVADEGLGYLTSAYAGLQFYANLPLAPATDASAVSTLSSRVWFSELHDPEAVDLSPADGDFFDVISQVGGNTPIMAIVGLQNALAIIKESELFALYGTDPSTFQIRKIADVGTVSPMSVVPYKSGVIFAGREGMYFFDGATIQELSTALGQFYREGIVGFDPATDRAYGAVFRGHYLLSMTNFASGYSPTRGSAATAITAGTLVLNLSTGALSWFTNLQFKGWINLPASTGFDAWFVVDQDTTRDVIVCDANALWNDTGLDGITCQGETAGPQFYIESKRYDITSPERLKSLKQLAMHYILEGDTLSMDVIPGLGETGNTTRTPWPIQTTMLNKRLQFLHRDTHIGFRLWPTNNLATNIIIGPWAIGFKLQREGRT